MSKKVGRPTKYSPALAEKIIELYRNPVTDKQVAEIVGIDEKTLNNWKRKHPEFFLSIKMSKAEIDGLVEHALFSRAVGYTHVEEKVFCSFGEIVTHKSLKHYPPNVTAAIFWLLNRQPERWKRAPGMIPETPKDPPKKKTFEEFCLTAGYPAPYPKQIEMKDWIMYKEGPGLLLGSRGYGKSDYAVIMGVAYDIYVNKESRTLLISKDKEKNAAMLKEIHSACVANGVEFELVSSKRLRVAGIIGKAQTVNTATVRSVSLRGQHPDRVIFDDPVTPEDVSEATRKRLETVYEESFKLCKNLRFVGQPVHKFDLYAKLRTLIPTLEVPHGTIPELDHDLEAQRIAGISESSIQASYFLKIIDDGSLPFQNVKYLKSWPAGESQAVAFIDPSEGGDYTAMSIIKGHMDGVAVKGRAWKKPWFHCFDDMVKELVACKVGKICFETNKTGRHPLEQLRKLLNPHGIGVDGKDSTSNKEAVIMAAGSYSHLIFLCKDSDKTYLEQVVKYEYDAEYDDSPDSLARCLEWIGLIRGKK